MVKCFGAACLSVLLLACLATSLWLPSFGDNPSHSQIQERDADDGLDSHGLQIEKGGNSTDHVLRRSRILSSGQGTTVQLGQRDSNGEHVSVADQPDRQRSVSSDGRYGLKRDLEADELHYNLTNPSEAAEKRADEPSNRPGGASSDPVANEPEVERPSALLTAGYQSLEQMFTDIGKLPASVKQSTWWSTNQFTIHQWSKHLSNGADLTQLQFLDGLRGVESFETDYRHIDSGRRSRVDQVSLANPANWKESTLQYKRTTPNAMYHTINSYSQEVVAVMDARSPWPQVFNPHASAGVPGSQPWPDHVPDPHELSDAVTAEYLESEGKRRHNTRATAPPRWFVIMTPDDKEIDPQTNEVIQGFQDTYDIGSIPRWPGITYPIGSTTYLQLLATPSTKWVPWLLITQKHVFGDGVIASITVFDRRPPGQNEPPSVDAYGKPRRLERLSFLLNVQRKTDLLMEARTKNTKFEASGGQPFKPKYKPKGKGQLSDKDGPNWPYPMRPITRAGFSQFQVPQDPGPNLPPGGSGQGPPPPPYTGKGKGKAPLVPIAPRPQ